MFLDFLQDTNNLESFRKEAKFKAEISEWLIYWEKTILVKPQTFMNLSWESVQKISSFYKIEQKDFIVIYDDISMDFAKIRFRNDGSAGWHNWVKDIIKYFWDKWKRIKIWVWFNDNYEVSDWVLSKFSENEIRKLEDYIFQEAAILLEKNIL